MTIQISQSEIATWMRCPRKWLLTYWMGVAPAEEQITGTAICGTRVHTALQGWREQGLDPVATLGVLYALAATRHPEHAAELAAEHELTSIMVSGYLEWLEETGSDNGLELVAAEHEVTVPVPGLPGVELRAKLDAVFRDTADGSLSFLDYKTADSFEAHEVLGLNPQFKIYSLIEVMDAAARGEPAMHVRGGFIDTLRRVKRTAKSKPPYYQRDPFRYNLAELEATARKVGKICADIEQARITLDRVYGYSGGSLATINILQQTEFPPNEMPRDCSWSCPFSGGLCTMMNDGSDWPGVITESGRYAQGDPYKRYSDDPLGAIRAEIAAGVRSQPSA